MYLWLTGAYIANMLSGGWVGVMTVTRLYANMLISPLNS